MKIKYDIENLIRTFEKHVEKSQSQRKIDLERFPDAEWLQDDFNISSALLSMCQEIDKINSWIDRRMSNDP